MEIVLKCNKIYSLSPSLLCSFKIKLYECPSIWSWRNKWLTEWNERKDGRKLKEQQAWNNIIHIWIWFKMNERFENLFGNLSMDLICFVLLRLLSKMTYDVMTDWLYVLSVEGGDLGCCNIWIWPLQIYYMVHWVQVSLLMIGKLVLWLPKDRLLLSILMVTGCWGMERSEYVIDEEWYLDAVIVFRCNIVS